ncbi:MAG: penicillin-binding transpeptidase domain-containing protein [Candidatus Omnitrophota bacterium]
MCSGRLFFVQFFRSQYLVNLAKKQHNFFVELEPLRGAIYDRNLKVQAMNIPVDSLYASPSAIVAEEKEELINKLSSLLGLDRDYLKDRLYRKKDFVWIKRKLSPGQSEGIRKLDLNGLGFIRESRRSYPNSYLASHVIGFAGLDNIGLEGAEHYYNDFLKGNSGWAVFLRDARQKKLALWEQMVLPKDGYDLVLTIDEVIQYIVEREIDQVVKKYNAESASVIVMDPHTGAVLALASRPTYDLNDYSKVSKDEIRNRAICDMFEPGSVFKIVTLSAALEEDLIKEEDKFFCEEGSYQVANHLLHDHRPHGWLTFKDVIKLSSNIGTTKAAQILGPEIIYKYMKLFGFGSKLGIDLLGEISGVAKKPSMWSKVSIAAIPIGHEVGVSALQLVSAISVIANGGQLMKPYILEEIRDKHGQRIRRFEPVMIHKAISLDTAQRAKDILKSVVEDGTGKSASIPGISAAGKTGTAQKLNPDGTYSHSKFIASFVGFAPVEDPIVAIIVTVNDPRPVYFGGVVAAPVFKNIAGDTIKYLKTIRSSYNTIALNESKNFN